MPSLYDQILSEAQALNVSSVANKAHRAKIIGFAQQGQRPPPPPQTIDLGFHSWTPDEWLAGVGRKHSYRSRDCWWEDLQGEDFLTIREVVLAKGFLPEINWSNETYKTGGVVRSVSLAEIASGAQDARITRAATQMRDYGVPVLLRWCPEMNGYWHSYCGFEQDGSSRAEGPSVFIAAWRRVRLVLKANAPAVKMLWVPNLTSSDGAGNTPDAYWPGDDQVDAVGVDAYPDDSGMDAVLAIAQQHYDKHPGHPFCFPEWGGNFIRTVDDPSVVTKMRDWVLAHPRVFYMSWWDGRATTMASMPETQAAYRTAFTDPRFKPPV